MTKPAILVLDTETTGLDDPIGVVEIAWLKVDEDFGVVLDSEFSSLVNPEMPINCSAAGVHGVRECDIKKENPPTLAELPWPTDPVILVCHNVAFDRPLVEPYLNIVDELCTMRLARKTLPDSPDHKLQTLSCFCELSRELAHRALGDVLTVTWLLDYIAEGMEMSFDELMELSKQRFIFQQMPFGKHKGLNMQDVPKSYLGWLSKQDLDKDMRDTVNYWLRR